MSYIDDDLTDPTVEAAFGADLTVDPETWAYTDLTSRLRNSPLSISRGRADETSQATPASVTTKLDNVDGELTPDQIASSLWPNVRRGTPLRIRHASPETRLAIPLDDTAGGPPGAGASTPDAAALDIVGDIFVGLEFTPVRGRPGQSVLAAKYNSAGDQRGWLLWSSGIDIRFRWSTNGTNAGNVERTLELAAGRRTSRFAIGVHLDVNNGAGGHTVSFYWARKLGDPWELIDQQTNAGVTSIFANTSAMYVGDPLALLASQELAIHRLEVRSGDDTGALVASPDFTSQLAGDTSFADAQGNVWTTTGTATITDQLVRLVGNVGAWAPDWPAGDISDAEQAGESVVDATAAGILRRLGQGNRSLRSALYRYWTGDNLGTYNLQPKIVYGYWPMEDEPGSTYAASAIDGPAPINAVGWTFGAAAPNGSGPLMERTSGSESWSARPIPFATAEGWSVMVMARVTSTATEIEIIKVNVPDGTIDIGIGSTGIVSGRWIDTSGTATSSVNLSTGFLTGGASGWKLFSISVDSGTLDYEVAWVSLDNPTVFNSGTLTTGLTAVGYPSRATRSGAVPASGGIAYGHLVFINSPFGWSFVIDTPFGSGLSPYLGWTGETAVARITRLCDEESIACDIIGLGPSPDTVLPDDSSRVGPQRIAGLVALLTDAANADQGILTEIVERIGVSYRPRGALYNAPPVLTLSAAGNQIGPPFRPTLDDQRLRNDVTAQRIEGSSYQAADPDSIEQEGLYETSVSLNLYTDGQLADAAGWRLHVGTWPGMRYPAVTVNLMTVDPDVAAWALGLREGDRIHVTDLPPQHPTDAVDLRIEGLVEGIGRARWTLQFNCSPAGPWDVAILEEFGADTITAARLESDGAELTIGIDEVDVTFDVTTPDGPQWITTASHPLEFPFDITIGGEVMRVTGIVGAASPQAFTVTRSVNGIVKSHAAGAAVELTRPAILAE